MSRNNQRYYQAGFTLVETMVSVAIMTLVVLGVLQILGMQLKVSNTARIDADVSNTVFLVNAVLKNSNACKENINNFGNKKVTLPVSVAEKLTVPAIDYPMGGGQLVKVGSTSNSKSAILKDMHLTNFKLLSNSGGNNIISSELVLQFEKPQAVGAQVTSRKVAVQLRADTSGTILDCSGEGTELTPFQLQTVCLASDGTFDFATKKCTLPKPVIPPPQTIVMQMPVPVPVPVAVASASNASGVTPNQASGFGSGSGQQNIASNAGNVGPSQARPATLPPAPAPAPALVAAAVVPLPQPAYVPPPVPVYVAPPPPPPPVQQGPRLYLVSGGCVGAGGVTTSSSCRTIVTPIETNGVGYLECDGSYAFSGTSQICNNPPLN